MKGFKSTLKYWDLPKESFLDIGFNDVEYADIHLRKIVGDSFFSIKLNSIAMREIRKRLFKVTFLGVRKFSDKKYSADFRFEFHYPDLVRILEIIEKEDC